MKFEEFKRLPLETQVVVRILERIEAKVDLMLEQNDEIVAHQRRLTEGLTEMELTLEQEINREHERTNQKLGRDAERTEPAAAGSARVATPAPAERT